jgi:hypothetical protein
LAFPWADEAVYDDAWRGEPAAVYRQDDQSIVSLELGPHDVGCVVVRRKAID